MPFVSAFAYTDIISMPLVFSFILLLIIGAFVLKEAKIPKGFLGFDILVIFMFFFVVMFSHIINGWGNSKSFNHTAAYTGTIILFYIVIKFTLFFLEEKTDTFKLIIKLITYTTTVSALYVNFEFILANFFDLNINDYIPRPREEQMHYQPYVIELFYRARGFASESGIYTLMLEMFAPLSVYFISFSGYCKWPKIIKGFVFTIIIFSAFFAASSATFIVVPIAILISMLAYFKKVWVYFKNKQIDFYLKLTGILTLVVLIGNYFALYAKILLSLSEKMNSSSLDDRKERMDFFFEQFSKFDINNKLIGAGPAGFDILGFDDSKSIISLYYSITFELGFTGLVFIILLIFYFLFSILRFKTKFAFFLLVAFLSGAMHFYIINNYWVPWFWFIGVIAVYYRNFNHCIEQKLRQL